MNVKEFYSEVNGNYQAALSLMMNDSFIERLLGKFFSNNSFNDIVSSFEKKDYQTLFASVHSFKGVVGNLQITPLYDLACTITEKTRSLSDVNIDSEIKDFSEK